MRGPRPEPTFPSRCELPFVDEDLSVGASNSDSMSPSRQSAVISKLEFPGILREIPPEEFVISISSLGGEEKRTEILPSRLSILTLPPGFSMETS